MIHMIGQAISSCEQVPRRWLQRLWGYSDIHTRQKWMVLRSALCRLPEKGVHLLDAGCGRGSWALELAATRPNWSIVGLDRELKSLDVAEASRRRMGLSNVSFVQADFLEFQSEAKFDVVLSVASAHYLAEAGKGEQLFNCFHSWLKPGGQLLLIGPRHEGETLFVSLLPQPERRRGVFAAHELKDLCRVNGLAVETLCGRIGKLGTLAKQLDWVIGSHFLSFVVGLYPLQWCLTLIDSRRHFDDAEPTLLWLLVARAVV